MYKYDFLQAKLHGIHSKSIVGDNFNKLKNIKSIDTLKKNLFPDDNSIISERNLYSYLEKVFKIKVFRQINYVSKFFNYKNPFINKMILRYEIDNVKLLINTFLSGNKKIEKMFEVDLKGTLNYQLVYSLDISDIKNIKLILNNTLFNFIIPMIEENKDLFYIDNELDKFYYDSLLDSLKSLRQYERDILKKIIIFEMNWQNITWAFRIKLYYKKSFANTKESFLYHLGLIKPEVLEKIFQLEFVPDEAKKFVDETGVNALAIAIGSKHGFYKGEPKLDLDRLKEIKEKSDVCLVLHGGSGVPKSTLREAIKFGITKVNVATDDIITTDFFE